jgi:predicted RNase H-like HicB family nuclease
MSRKDRWEKAGWGELTMYRYEVIIYWSKEDNAYIAEVPELPGCMADGATYRQTLDNVQVVIEQEFKRYHLPQPK